MVLNTRHTGIVVHDLERAIRFYEGLGMKQLSRMIETGDYIDKLVGLSDVKLEWVKLQIPDGTLVELLQYHADHSVAQNGYVRQAANRIGCSHIAFTVSDIESVIEYITMNGGTVHGTYQLSPDKKVKVIYGYDMEGNILEIVELLNPPL